ncbi:MAG: M14 family zinc carboxypeptidase [Solirubrobacterales bacterium]
MRRRRASIGAALATLAALATGLGGLIVPAAAKDSSLGGSAAAGGVTVESSPYRYLAFSPRTQPRLTVVERIDLAGGQVGRWWTLRGGWLIPAGSYDLGGAGLSADGGTLVLAATANGNYGQSPRMTRLAVLDTRTHLRHPPRGGREGPAHAVTRTSLRGQYEVDAVSPDGSTAYLTRYLHDGRGGADFEVRALETAGGRLAPAPIAARDGRSQPLNGSPISRVSGRGGRWSYALYVDEGGETFLLGLDTVGGRLARVDLPQLRFQREPFLLRLGVSEDGRGLTVLRPEHGRHGRPSALATVPLPIAASAEPAPRRHGFLDSLFTPVHPGNLLGREEMAGRSAEGRPIEIHQYGDPVLPGVLVFGCIHGDECAARGLEPRFVYSGGCPDPEANIAIVRDLDPDGSAAETRLNGRGVDLNRNFPFDWRAIGRRGDPEYAGPRPFSEPESRLAARIIGQLDPTVTIWFHQHAGPHPLVRAWGQSAPAGRLFAHLAAIPFHLLPWMDGTAPNWQNHQFPGRSSYVVELPPGPLSPSLGQRIGTAIVKVARWQAQVGQD